MIDREAALDLWLEAGGPLRFRIVSGSMAPTIRAGEYVEVMPVTHLRPGDIVLARGGDLLIVHRLLITWPVYLTQGDAVPRFDRPWQRMQILGTVVAIERDGEMIALPHFPRSLLALAVAIMRPRLRAAWRWARRSLPARRRPVR